MYSPLFLELKEILESIHAQGTLLKHLHRVRGRSRARDRGDHRNLQTHGGAADFATVAHVRLVAVGRHNHEGDVAVAEHVADVRAALVNLLRHGHGEPSVFQRRGGATGRHQRHSNFGELLRDFRDGGLVRVAHGDEHLTRAVRQPLPRGDLCLGVRPREIPVDAHHLPGTAHLRSQKRVRARELVERQHRLLHGDVIDHHLLREVDILQHRARHHERRVLRERVTNRLRDERHGARRARVRFDDVHFIVRGHGPLDVNQADDAETLRDLRGPVANDREGLFRYRLRRDAARGISRVHASLLDVLHDTADNDVTLGIAQGVDVEFGSVREVLVDEHRLFRVDLHGGGDVTLQVRIGADDLHRASTEDERGADHDGVPDVVRSDQRLSLGASDAAGGLGDFELLENRLPPLAILRRVDAVRRGA
mmetsp:Transcript_2574/g.8263  ORF Transcript_2574/g.8263 Transcript_2574/m.8263 type:complete len:423 (-) Transcript_2574:2395-3663(-)